MRLLWGKSIDFNCYSERETIKYEWGGDKIQREGERARSGEDPWKR